MAWQVPLPWRTQHISPGLHPFAQLPHVVTLQVPLQGVLPQQPLKPLGVASGHVPGGASPGASPAAPSTPPSSPEASIAWSALAPSPLGPSSPGVEASPAATCTSGTLHATDAMASSPSNPRATTKRESIAGQQCNARAGDAGVR